MYTLNGFQKQWIAALRSGDFQQCRGSLCQVKEDRLSFCCLGVACEMVANMDVGIRRVQKSTRITFDGEFAGLPPNVWPLLKVGSSEGTFKTPVIFHAPCADVEISSLIGLNDSLGWTFSQIADYVEQNPENVFTE